MRNVWIAWICGCAMVFAAQDARAELVRCATSILGEARSFVYDPKNAALRENTSRRERLLGTHGAITCPGFVTLRAMTPELDDAGRAPFCLQWDRNGKTYLGYAEGPRDAWISCRKPSRSFCERVNGSAAAAGHIAASATDFAYDVGAQVLAHPAGGVVLQGQSAAIGGYLANFGSVALSNPVSVGAVLVTVVAAGGAVYVCSDNGAEGAALEAVPAQTLPDGAEIPTEARDARLGATLPATAPATGAAGLVPMAPQPPNPDGTGD